ncbi:MAG: flagellar hook assembly protein FlgD [Pseudomonadota bacterium]
METNPIQSPQTSTAESAVATTQLTANFDTFLTLLTAQLQNQDPLDPLDTEKFTEQLVQFSSVEQSIQTNQNLETLIGLQASASNGQALSMIGQTAEVASAEARLNETGAEWRVTLPDQAEQIALTVQNENGETIAVLEGQTNQGEQVIHWNGERRDGTQAPQGTYTLNVVASDVTGNRLDAQIAINGRVSAVTFDTNGARIEIGGAAYNVADVIRVSQNLNEANKS